MDTECASFLKNNRVSLFEDYRDSALALLNIKDKLTTDFGTDNPITINYDKALKTSCEDAAKCILDFMVSHVNNRETLTQRERVRFITRYICALRLRQIQALIDVLQAAVNARDNE